MGTSAGCDNNIASTAAALCLSETDLLVLELCASAGTLRGSTLCWRCSSPRSSLIADRSTSAWVPIGSGGGLTGCGRIRSGHPLSCEGCLVDDGHTSDVASAGATTSLAPTWGQPVVDVETCLDPVLVGVATPGDVTVVVATKATSRTPSPQTTSPYRRLKRFTERITKVRQLAHL